MSIQHLAIIFIIIILPISIVLSAYIGSQIDTISKQTLYNTSLYTATYDSVKAFQLNTVNNRYSSVSDSKIRDIEASVNTFYTSLSDNINISALGKEGLEPFVPALLYTLYDGYYIYSKYNNVHPEEQSDILDEDNGKEQSGLRPYIYYSCRYKTSNKDFVVNYTLDNAITIYGDFGSTKKTMSGYLINTNLYSAINRNANTLVYDGIKIEPEILTEYLLFSPDEYGNAESGNYEYLVYGKDKIYYEGSDKYFWYKNYKKSYVTKYNQETLKYLKARTSNNGHLYSTSAYDYFIQAYDFTNEVREYIGNVKQSDAVDANGNPIEFKIQNVIDSNSNIGDIDYSVQLTGKNLFNTSNNNDPLLSDSPFNEHRRLIIRKSIETNLSAAIAYYNNYSSNSYEFALPILKESDWEKILNNVSMITFLQGIPIGNKYYNDYCIVTNDYNEEVVKQDSIYIITVDQNGNREYHLPGCRKLIDNMQGYIKEAYSNLSFLRQTVRISEGNYIYFYPQMRKPSQYITGCYDCIVSASDTYNLDQLLKGEIVKNKDITGQSGTIYNKSGLQEIRKKYVNALARERYDFYKANILSMQ